MAAERLSSNPNHHLDRDPFVVRGHHLRLFAALKSSGPWKMAANDYEASQVEAITSEDREYLRDVWGENQLEARKRQVMSIFLYRRFNTLPERHPIDIVAGIPDEICAIAAVGKHCVRRFSPNNKGSIVEFQDDQRYLDCFEAYADNLGLADQVKVTTREAQFSDFSEGVIVPCLETNAGVVHRILTNPMHDWSPIVSQ